MNVLNDIPRSDLIQLVKDKTAKLETLRAEVAASKGLKCPSCDDTGGYGVQIAEDEWDQVQCEFCWCVDDSIFNRKRAGQ